MTDSTGRKDRFRNGPHQVLVHGFDLTFSEVEFRVRSRYASESTYNILTPTSFFDRESLSLTVSEQGFPLNVFKT